MKLLIVIISLVLFVEVSAQKKKIFISRPKNPQGSLLKFKVLVNGQLLVFPNNSYAELELDADSVTLEIPNTGSTERSDARIVTKDSVAYISVFSYYPGGMKKDVVALAKICQTCYEDNKKKSNREVTFKE